MRKPRELIRLVQFNSFPPIIAKPSTPMRFLIYILLVTQAFAFDPPRIVAIPPADAGLGLVRVAATEIRHYPGKGGTSFLRSTDNGETWESVKLPKSYPGATCLAKESPAFARNPNNGEFLRVEPLYRGGSNEGMYVSKGGIDGTWQRLESPDGKPTIVGGILRTPIWVNDNKRVLIPGRGGGCYTWYSDNSGATWQKSNTINSPAHEAGGVHEGSRWNHGMVEATIVELKNKKLWLIARTAQDQHYQSFSDDFGTTWSPAEPSRFWGTITMPTIHRLKDDRLLFLWSNTTPLPEVKRDKKYGGEDVFTNRDTIHAAIYSDDGKTWSGFRELILDEHRNNTDYAVTPGSNDRGKHQAEIVQLDANRVLFTCGQHPLHRRLMIMDLRWLDEKQRNSNLQQDGTRDWSTHQYIDKIVGHCGYNRKPGAQVEGDALRVLRIDDPTLTNPNQGATWNFPASESGTIHTRIRLEKGGAGIQIALCDRWFNPTDATVDQFANHILKIDAEGKAPDGTQILTPGKTHTLTLNWKDAATVSIDGKSTGLTLPLLHECPNGISYIHFYNPAESIDLSGFSVLAIKAEIE